MTWIVAIATLLLRSACRFLEANLQEMANTLASNVKYHFRFGISNSSHESNFNQIGWSITIRIFKGKVDWNKRWRHNSAVTSCLTIFWSFFWENLSNSTRTADFIKIEPETTKLKEVGGINASPYCSDFNIARTQKIILKIAISMTVDGRERL